MKLQLVPIYGSIGYLCTANAGETHTLKSPITANNKPLVGLNYVINGTIVLQNKRTKDVIEVYKTDSYFDNTSVVSLDTSSLLEYDFSSDAEWLCIMDKVNPNTESFSMKDKEERTVLKGTNLFLLKGTVTIKGTTFTGPNPIRIKTSDVLVTATENCYLLEVK